MKFLINYAVLAMLVKLTSGEEACKNNIVVFGDSLSDTGNLFGLTGAALPPTVAYDSGRFTNGKIWVEYLAELMELETPTPFYASANPGTNYAIAGAASGDNATTAWQPVLLPPGNVITLPSKGLRLQTEDFLAANEGICSSEMLFVIWSGAVDFAILGNGPEFNGIIENIKDSIEDLIAVGGNKFLVLNLPPIADSPGAIGTYTSLFFKDNLPADLDGDVQSFNAGLKDMLKSVNEKNDDAIITHVDVVPLFNEVSSNPAKFGIALDTGIPTLSEADLHLKEALVFINAENALWYDGIHPTSTFHNVVAESVYKVLKGIKGKKGKKGSKSKGIKGPKGPKSPKRRKSDK